MKRIVMGTSLVVQLRLCAPKEEGMGSIPSQRTRAHIPQLKILCTARKIPHALMKIEDPACCKRDPQKKKRERGDWSDKP